MQVSKDQVIQLLEEQGNDAQAQQAQQSLPDQVDTDQHADLLSQHGVNVQDLLGKFGGGLGNVL